MRSDDNTSYCSSGEIIVDFPSLPMRRDCKSMKVSNKSVSFSSMAKVSLFARSSEDEKRASWYSKEEYRRIRGQMRSEVAVMIRRNQQSPDETPSDECIVGLENYLSQETMKKVMQRRIVHTRGVLKEQNWQMEMCYHDPSRLACVSRKLSKSSEYRAVMVAVTAYEENLYEKE